MHLWILEAVFSTDCVSIDELKGNGPLKVQTDIFWMHIRQNHWFKTQIELATKDKFSLIMMLGVSVWLTWAKCHMDDMLLIVSKVAMASSVLPSMSRWAA